MDTKYLNFFLILVIVLLIVLNVLANFRNQENFQDLTEVNNTIEEKLNSSNNAGNNAGNNDMGNPDNLKAMMEALSNSEALCDELEKRQENRDLLEQYAINKNTIQELTSQRKRIEELRRVLNHLRREKKQRESVANKCKVKAQEELNKDYTLVKKLTDSGLLKDTSVKVNLNVSEQLKRNLKDIKTSSNNKVVRAENGIPLPRHITKKCKSVDTDKYIHADKLRGKCHNCDVDKLLKKNDLLKRDFA
jgi:hypothetical protein